MRSSAVRSPSRGRWDEEGRSYGLAVRAACERAMEQMTEAIDTQMERLGVLERLDDQEGVMETLADLAHLTPPSAKEASDHLNAASPGQRHGRPVGPTGRCMGLRMWRKSLKTGRRPCCTSPVVTSWPWGSLHLNRCGSASGPTTLRTVPDVHLIGRRRWSQVREWTTTFSSISHTPDHSGTMPTEAVMFEHHWIESRLADDLSLAWRGRSSAPVHRSPEGQQPPCGAALAGRGWPMHRFPPTGFGILPRHVAH